MEAVLYIRKEYIKQIFELLNESKIEYVYIDNLYGDVPDSISDGQAIEILVKPEDKDLIREIFYEHDYLNPRNIFGRETGWNFMYQLPENQYWKLPRANQDVYVLVNFKLCCKSLMPKTWIPLDQSINDDVWAKSEWDEDNNLWRLDKSTQFIMYIVQSVFNEQGFTDKVKRVITEEADLLQTEEVRKKLEKVFFKYTDRLYDRLLAGELEQIHKDYITYQQY